MYIHKISTISFQPIFDQSDFVDKLKPIDNESSIQHPNYKEFITPMALRRMTEFSRMTIANGKMCTKDLKEGEVGGIIVGTALGSTVHTGKFMEKIIMYDGGLVSPTSFILSTHNTAAGQLSLELGCQGYNNTHVQSTLSFEHSLIDAALCLEERRKNIVVGSVEESDNLLFHTAEKVGSDEYPTTYGSTFLLVNDEPASEKIKIQDVDAKYKPTDIFDNIHRFLKKNDLSIDEIDEVLFATRDQITIQKLNELFTSSEVYSFEQYSGSYLTSSSFGLHMAYDKLTNKENVSKILLVNNLLNCNLGLTLIIEDVK